MLINFSSNGVNKLVDLTQGGLVTPYGVEDRGKHWVK